MSELISNRRSVLKSAFGLAAAASMPAGAFAKVAPKVPVTATALNDHLLLVSGLGGNVLALRSDDGLLLVDTGAPGATSKLQSELKKFARGAKVTTVINTHWHTDQSGGNRRVRQGRREAHLARQGRAAHGDRPVRALGKTGTSRRARSRPCPPRSSISARKS